MTLLNISSKQTNEKYEAYVKYNIIKGIIWFVDWNQRGKWVVKLFDKKLSGNI